MYQEGHPGDVVPPPWEIENQLQISSIAAEIFPVISASQHMCAYNINKMARVS
jgi:hypothetical protein